VNLKYYIRVKPGTDGNYTIHRQDCPLLPDPGRRILMGIFRSLPDALKRGSMFHVRLALCPFCLKSNNYVNNPDFSSGESGTELIVSAKLKSSLTDVLVCTVN
jgi:hypothetical protein